MPASLFRIRNLGDDRTEQTKEEGKDAEMGVVDRVCRDMVSPGKWQCRKGIGKEGAGTAVCVQRRDRVCKHITVQLCSVI